MSNSPIEEFNSQAKPIEYFKHTHGCGSGHTRVYIKKEENKVELLLRKDWMGSGAFYYDLVGEYLNIDGPYGVILFRKCVYHVTDYESKTPREIIEDKTLDIDLAFDAYMFDKPLKTEWLQHQDKYAIGLYCGNGCQSTENFQLHLTYNSDITEPIDKCWDKLIWVLSGLKYEKTNADHFNQATL